MGKKFNQWLIGIGAAGSGTISSFLPLTPKTCTGSCGSCGALCIPGVLVGSYLMASYLYKQLKNWRNTSPKQETYHEY